MPDEEVMKFTLYVRSEGRITLPKEIKDALKIKVGDLVKGTIEQVKI